MAGQLQLPPAPSPHLRAGYPTPKAGGEQRRGACTRPDAVRRAMKVLGGLLASCCPRPRRPTRVSRCRLCAASPGRRWVLLAVWAFGRNPAIHAGGWRRSCPPQPRLRAWLARAGRPASRRARTNGRAAARGTIHRRGVSECGGMSVHVRYLPSPPPSAAAVLWAATGSGPRRLGRFVWGAFCRTPLRDKLLACEAEVGVGPATCAVGALPAGGPS